MKLKKVLVHASQALFAVIVLSYLAVGCGKREESKPLPEVYTAEGHGYMKDPAFMKQVEAQDREKKSILGERAKLFEEMAALEEKAGSRAAAEKLPEWKALKERMDACARTFESNRWQSVEIFRERMKRAQEDSERVKRGEAKAKEISK